MKSSPRGILTLGYEEEKVRTTCMTKNKPAFLGKNIIEHLRATGAAVDATREHFRHESKLFKAIEAHILGVKNSVLLDAAGKISSRPSAPPRAYSVNFLKAWRFFNQPDEVPHFALNVSVSFQDDDESDKSYDYKEFTFCIPSHLELDFTVRKFQLWLKQVQQKNRKNALRDDLKAIEEIAIRHESKLAKKLYEELKATA